MLDAHFIGGPELLGLVGQLPRRVKGNIGRGAARAGMKVVATEAQSIIAKRSRQIAKSLKLSSRIDGNVATAKVTSRGPGSYLSRWWEYGVQPHSIGPSTRTVLKIGERFVSGGVEHPGMAGVPFLRPALEVKRSEAIVVAGQYIAGRLTWKTLASPTLDPIEDDE